MSSITLPPSSHPVAEDDALKVRLQSSLAAFMSGPNDVWIASGFCFDTISISIEYSVLRYDLRRSELEIVMDCMAASLQDFQDPDDFAGHITAMLYYFFEITSKDLGIQAPQRFREALYYAMIRTFNRDIDLIPFQMWKLAHALDNAARGGFVEKAVSCLADIRSLLLAPYREGAEPRYHHEPDQHFLNTSNDEEKDDELPLTGLSKIRSVYDPAIPLDDVLQSTDGAHNRLARLIERQQTLRREASSDEQYALLLADRIEFTRCFINWIDLMNENIRKERSRRLH